MSKQKPQLQFFLTSVGKLIAMGQAEKWEDKIALAIKEVCNEFNIEGVLFNTLTKNEITINKKQPDPVEDDWTHSRG